MSLSPVHIECNTYLVTGIVLRSLSYIITGTEDQHLQVRGALLNHLASIEGMIGHHINGEYSSVVEYIIGTNMDRYGIWGTHIELITASHVKHFP